MKYNRLKGTKAYLSGPMDRCPQGGVVWRTWLASQLQAMGIGVLNPCDKPTDFAKESNGNRELVSRLKKQGRFQEVKDIMKPICHVDLRMVDECSFLICYIDLNIHSAGSYDELVTAIRQRKPTLLVCEQGIDNIPNWWFGIAPYEMFFSDFDEMLEYLVHVDSAERVEHLNRWLFFDYEKVFGKK